MISRASAKEPSLQELQDRWTERIEASLLTDISAEKYKLKISTMTELLAQTDNKHLESYIRESATAKPLERNISNPGLPKQLDEFQEFLRMELLRKCLEESHDNPPTLLLLETATPERMHYTMVELSLARKMGPDGIALLLQAAGQAQSELVRERLFAMLQRAFPGLCEKHPDETQFLKSCSLWLTGHRAKVKVADVYYPMNPVISQKRPGDKPPVPDCALFVQVSASGP